MENNIVFISKGTTFLSNTLKEQLREGGYQVVDCEPDIIEFKLVEKTPGYYLFFAGPFVHENTDFLAYLKDVCREQDRKLLVIGSKEELASISQRIPDSYIRRAFERPLNSADVLGEISFWQLEGAFDEQKKSILIVDDDPMFLRSAKSWLEDGYQVTMVSSGMNAITYLASHSPDLILLDYEMPVADGKQILDMIRSEVSTKDVPVMFLTAKNDRESVTKVMSLKPNGYLLKDMAPSEIRQKIDEFLQEEQHFDFW